MRIGITDIALTDYETIEQKVSEYLQKQGFNADYTPTPEGIICESILDMLDKIRCGFGANLYSVADTFPLSPFPKKAPNSRWVLFYSLSLE